MRKLKPREHRHLMDILKTTASERGRTTGVEMWVNPPTRLFPSYELCCRESSVEISLGEVSLIWDSKSQLINLLAARFSRLERKAFVDASREKARAAKKPGEANAG